MPSNRHRLAIILAAVFASASPVGVATAQVVSNAPTGQLQRVPSASVQRAMNAFDAADQRLSRLRSEIERLDQSKQSAGRAQAVQAFRAVLLDLRPAVGQAAAAASLDRTPEAVKMVDQYSTWRAEYAKLAGVGDAAAFQGQIARRWDDATQNVADWSSESDPVTWQRISKNPSDPVNQRLGLPKTAAFAQAATKFLGDVRQSDGFMSYGDAEEVSQSIAKYEKARQQAFKKLAERGRQGDRIRRRRRRTRSGEARRARSLSSRTTSAPR